VNSRVAINNLGDQLRATKKNLAAAQEEIAVAREKTAALEREKADAVALSARHLADLKALRASAARDQEKTDDALAALRSSYERKAAAAEEEHLQKLAAVERDLAAARRLLEEHDGERDGGREALEASFARKEERQQQKIAELERRLAAAEAIVNQPETTAICHLACQDGRILSQTWETDPDGTICCPSDRQKKIHCHHAEIRGPKGVVVKFRNTRWPGKTLLRLSFLNY